MSFRTQHHLELEARSGRARGLFAAEDFHNTGIPFEWSAGGGGGPGGASGSTFLRGVAVIVLLATSAFRVPVKFGLLPTANSETAKPPGSESESSCVLLLAIGV